MTVIEVSPPPDNEKLVRDRIPENPDLQPRGSTWRRAEKVEIPLFLCRKLVEETEEFQRDKNAEEMADVREVLLAICSHFAFDRKRISALRRKKFTGSIDELSLQLVERAKRFENDQNIELVADVRELIEQICIRSRTFSWSDVEEFRQQKRSLKGAFTEGWVLILQPKPVSS